MMPKGLGAVGLVDSCNEEQVGLDDLKDPFHPIFSVNIFGMLKSLWNQWDMFGISMCDFKYYSLSETKF